MWFVFPCFSAHWICAKNKTHTKQITHSFSFVRKFICLRLVQVRSLVYLHPHQNRIRFKLQLIRISFTSGAFAATSFSHPRQHIALASIQQISLTPSHARSHDAGTSSYEETKCDINYRFSCSKWIQNIYINAVCSLLTWTWENLFLFFFVFPTFYSFTEFHSNAICLRGAVVSESALGGSIVTWWDVRPLNSERLDFIRR